MARGRHLEDRSALELVRALHVQDEVALRAVRRVASALARLSDRFVQALARGGRIFYVGAGTSGRLGMLDAVELPPTFGTSPLRVQALVAGGKRALFRAVEGAEDDEAAATRAVRKARLRAGDLILGISASGTTPFVLAALKTARAQGSGTALLVCRRRPRPASVQTLIVLETGPELIPGSTRLKAGTATKLALNTLSTVAMVRLGRVHQGQMVDLQVTNRKLHARAVALVSTLGQVSPARARALLRAASGHSRLAVAMALTGKPAQAAGDLLRRQGLSAL